MINIGNNEVNNLYVGSTPVQSVYVGDTQVWSNTQWHTIYEGDGSWFDTSHEKADSEGYDYGIETITIPIDSTKFKPDAKYRIYVEGLITNKKDQSTRIRKASKTGVPQYVECDQSFQIRFNSSFSNRPDGKRIYLEFYIKDDKLQCRIAYAYNYDNPPGQVSRKQFTYYVAILVTKIEQYY